VKVLDLFSGIGGFSLGLERAGMETVAFCEFDKKAQLVLKKHWPDVPIFDDVRELNYDGLRRKGLVGNSELHGRVASKKPGGIKKTGNDFKKGQKQTSELAGADKPRNGSRVGETQPRNQEPTIDLICGGFPCQPFSVAGKRQGKEDDRHLWPEYFRLIQEIRPRWVIGENVAGLINMGLDQVLSDLESAGYSCQTLVIPACAVNAPHRRDRVWIVANTKSFGHRGGQGQECGNDKWEIQQNEQEWGSLGGKTEGCCGGAKIIPYSKSTGAGDNQRGIRGLSKRCRSWEEGVGQADVAYSNSQPVQGGAKSRDYGTDRSQSNDQLSRGCGDGDGWWAVEPGMGRVAHGISNRVDRLKQLGNAVVPQVVEQIGRAIMGIETQ
jgi:DNA (cytosine-5)-methyltransferase 1